MEQRKPYTYLVSFALICVLTGLFIWNIFSNYFSFLDPLLSGIMAIGFAVAALAELALSVLGPMVIGLAAGAIAISFCMSTLFKRFYTATYSVIFGIFLSMIPNMLNENCVLGFNGASAVSLVLLVAGFLVSYFLGKREKT